MVLVFSITGDVTTLQPTKAITLHDTIIKHWTPLTPDTVAALINFIDECMQKDEKVVSYGGASFGLKIIAQFVPESPKLPRIAKNHIDLLHLFVVDNGYRASLQSFLKESDSDEESVVYNIHKVYLKAANTGVLMRTAKSKQVFPWFIRQELDLPPISIPSVTEALTRPRTVPSWIKDPVSINETLQWLKDK